MIVYNVTVKIDHAVADDWLAWMRREHIPEVIATGTFTSYKLLRIVNDEEADGMTYAVQYVCPSRKQFDTFVRSYAPDLQKKHRTRYNNSFIAIRTLMQVVEEKVLFASDS